MSDTNALHSRSSSRDLAHFRQNTILQEAALMPIDHEQEQTIVVHGMQSTFIAQPLVELSSSKDSCTAPSLFCMPERVK
jgi:hypothetical protein